VRVRTYVATAADVQSLLWKITRNALFLAKRMFLPLNGQTIKGAIAAKAIQLFTNFHWSALSN